eukprot:scaffold197246_cov45-Prasinocladus_malaysianus.AAC.1
MIEQHEKGVEYLHARRAPGLESWQREACGLGRAIRAGAGLCEILLVVVLGKVKGGALHELNSTKQTAIRHISTII